MDLQEIKAGIERKKLDINFDQDFQHITYKEKIGAGLSELIDTDPNKVIKRGRKDWDDVFGGIYGGKIYLVGAETGSGKSTFVNQVARNVAYQGKRVVKYSLEDRMEDIAKEELYYYTNRKMREMGKETIKRSRFINNQLLDEEMEVVMQVADDLAGTPIIELNKNRDVSLTDLCKLMEQECDNGADLFVIDHLHYFEFENKDRLDLEIKNVMHKINEIARRRNVPIFLIAHYRNNTSGTPNPSYFRDGSAIKQVANVIIQIERDVEVNTSYFHITKMRGPEQVPHFECKFDRHTFEYSFEKTKRQSEAEKKGFSSSFDYGSAGGFKQDGQDNIL